MTGEPRFPLTPYRVSDPEHVTVVSVSLELQEEG
jgi:hypothetical protein